MPELKEVFEMVAQKVEPDLDMWNQQERRQRRAARNRRLGAIGLVAALAVLAAVIVVASSPKPDVPVDVGTDVQGAAPTLETLRGIWLFDGGPDGGETGMLMRFDPDGTFAIDAYGSLDSAPATQGTFRIEGDLVRLEVDPSARCATGETFTFRTGLPDVGRLDTVMVEPGCGVASGTEWTWTRVSPVSEAGKTIRATSPSGDAAPPGNALELKGIWLLEGTGQLLRISFSGSYAIDDQGTLGTSPSDEGALEIDGRTVVLISGPGSHDCRTGARWKWTAVAVEPFGTAMRATSGRDVCGHGLEDLELTWIRISSA
jgi:hypothetical protein